jgi:carboxyl-terminal processing protease
VSTHLRILSRIGIGTALSCLVLALVLSGEPPRNIVSSGVAEATAPAADVGSPGSRVLPAPASTIPELVLLERSARSLPPIEVSPDESSIAFLAARRLEMTHYSRQRFDDEVASRFLDRYIDSLDTLRLYFLQSDLDEFDRYRTQLDQLTLKGNTDPAREIFERYLQRMRQRVAFVAELLETESFDFTGDDRYRLDRRTARFPKDLDEARELWRRHLRHEILQEILSRPPADASSKSADTEDETRGEPELAPSGLPDDIVTTITRRYSRLLRTMASFDGGDVFEIYLSALAHVFDPHSDYMGRSTLDNFAINMNLALFGIGAVLQSVDGYCQVRELKPGPAMRSNRIQPGDRIVAVAQEDGEPVDVVDMRLNRVVELIRGPKDTRVRLTLIPVDATDPSERVEVTLTRDEIRLEDEEAKARLIEVKTDHGDPTRIGIIDLPSFYAPFDVGQRGGRTRQKSTSLDVAMLIDKLKQENVAGILLDLRRNGGGSLDEAINLTGLFTGQGPIVQIRDYMGRIIVEKNEHDRALYDGPLVVLTSRFSASASEILAGALQDYGRALIVGDSSTHGKGTVQSLVPLQPMLNYVPQASTNNPGAIKVTVRTFYRASGSSTQLKGVVPDIILPSVNNYADVGEASLDYALPWNEIPAVSFEPQDRIAPILPELRNRSEARIATDHDFLYIKEDINLYKKFLADRSVSLNEETRRREKLENDQRVEKRNLEIRSRPAPDETVYEITLKDVGLPGLPPPLDPTQIAKSDDSTPRVLHPDEPEEDATLKAPPVDATLREAQRILLDLVALSEPRSSLTTTRIANPSLN